MTDIIIPTYKRAHKIPWIVENIRAATPEPHRIIFVCDEDESMRAAALCGAVALKNEHAPSYAGAINTACDWSDAEWLFFGADDLDFQPGWLRNLQPKMYPPWCVIGTDDGDWEPVQAGVTATHVLVRNAYIREQGGTADRVPGVAMFEGYKHYCVEQELVMVAKKRGAWTPCLASVVLHKPDRSDEKAKQNAANFAEDRVVYDSRVSSF